MKLVYYTVPDKFDVSINGVTLDAATRTERAHLVMANDTWTGYPVAPGVLRCCDNELRVRAHPLNP